MADYVKLESILRAGGELRISDVKLFDNHVVFSLNGHVFQTYADKTIPKGHALFGHPLTDIWAAEENTPEGIEAQKNRSDEVNAELEQWARYKKHFLKFFFVSALHFLKESGDDSFMEYVENRVYITPEGEGKALFNAIMKSVQDEEG